jgi:hypothetical protein
MGQKEGASTANLTDAFQKTQVTRKHPKRPSFHPLAHCAAHRHCALNGASLDALTHPCSETMIPSLKVTLLVDAMSVAEHVRELVAWVQGQAQMQCCVVVLPCLPAVNYLGRPGPDLSAKAPGPWTRAWQELLWSGIVSVERWRMRSTQFKGRTDSLMTLQAIEFRGGVTVLDALKNESGDDHIQRVKSALRTNAPDVIVQCGSFARAKEFAVCAKHGVLEISYGNDPRFRGGPPGFWEVFYRADKTGFLIRQWSAEQGEKSASAKVKARPSVLMEGYLPTQGFFLLNQATLVLQASRHLQAILSKLANGTRLPSPKQNLPFDGKVRPCPSPAYLLAYAAGVAKRVMLSRVQSALGAQEQWGIHYARTDWKRLVLERSQRIDNPRGGYYADPFIHDTEHGRYCFVEEFRHAKNKGEIAVLRLGNGHADSSEGSSEGSENDGEPVRVGTALEESFHLSFPYLFEYEGELFMCPESHGSGQIRIYRCHGFPLQWGLHSVAMDAVAAVDTMIFPAHGVWWLMSSFHPLGDTETYPELHLFSAPDPLCGQWSPHAQNPLVVDPEFARNAGLLRDGDKIYRVSQARSFNAYGAWATVSEIKTLSLDDYQEDRVTQLKPSFNGRATGLHHLQSNDDFTVWDQKQWERVP